MQTCEVGFGVRLAVISYVPVVAPLKVNVSAEVGAGVASVMFFGALGQRRREAWD